MEDLKVFHNYYKKDYKKPFGSIRTGSEIDLKIKVYAEKKLAEVCLVTEHNEIKKTYKMSLLKSKEEDSDKKVFVYRQIVTAPEYPCLYKYYFKLLRDDEKYFYCKAKSGDSGQGMITDDKVYPYQIRVHNSHFKTPDWLKESCAYQIFVDRFCNGNQDNSISNPKKNSLIHAHWENDPLYIEEKEDRIKHWDFFGGNLKGVIEKLPYLKNYGINIIYLNPVFKSASNHKFDTVDYCVIDEMFGNKEIFEKLIKKAAKMDIKIIIKSVFAYTASQSLYFNKNNQFNSQGAYQSQESPYFEWYKFNDFPDDYKCWSGKKSLPQLRLTEGSLQDFIITNENSVLNYWMKTGIKGWKLEKTAGLTPDFIEKFYSQLKRHDPEAVLIVDNCEILNDRGKTEIDYLDSLSNSFLNDNMVSFITGKITSEKVFNKLMSYYNKYPDTLIFSSFNFLSTPDSKRIITLLEEKLLDNDEKDNNQQLSEDVLKSLKALIGWQVFSPGVPCLFYGDEAGLRGGSVPDNRHSYPWKNESEKIKKWYQEMIALRNFYDVLKTGDWELLYFKENLLGCFRSIENSVDLFSQKKDNNQAIFLVNNDKKDKSNISTDYILDIFDIKEQDQLYDFLDDNKLTIVKDNNIEIEPLSMKILLKKRWPEKLLKNRKAGILLHITSLPSKFGIGDLGENAFKFIDFLKKAGQKYWQILPINPVGFSASPYQCFSSFAGNTMLISPEKMLEDGLLSSDQLSPCENNKRKINFDRVKEDKEKLFKKAYSNFKNCQQKEGYQEFLQNNQYWLDDFCLFKALKEHFAGKSWPEWPQEIANRDYWALQEYKEKLRGKVEYHKFLQFVFYRQWQNLYEYAKDKGIKIIGDLPIFAAHDSSDVWANPELFKLDENGYPQFVAGVPPDYFSETGQRWGNPLYKWDKMQQNNYRWWKQRLKILENLVDVVRIDHFRGFEAYWQIPAEEETAIKGEWIQGPGSNFFEKIKDELDSLEIIAEDLGYITSEVEDLKNQFEFPGMKVIQFLTEPELEGFSMPLYQYNNVFYTGTHDNETIWQWFADYQKENGRDISKFDKREVCWFFIKQVYRSWASTAIIPLQDFLCLGEEGRMNNPGTIGNNWDWRFSWEELPEELASEIKNITDKYKR